MSVQHDPGTPWPEYVAETYAANRDELLRSLRRRLGSGELAEDVLQEAALQACTVRGPRPANVAAWLHTVALRRGIDALRRRESPQHPGTDMPDHRPDAHAQLLTRTELGVLRVAMRELPARQRKALALQVLEGASTQEIAGRLGVTEVGAKALVHRARRLLAERIAEVDLSCGEIRGQWEDASSRGVRAPARVHRHAARCPVCAAYLGGRRTLRARCSAVLGALWVRLPWESAGRIAPIADGQFVAGGKVCAGICVVALLGPGVGALTPPRASSPSSPSSSSDSVVTAGATASESRSGLRISPASNASSGSAAYAGRGGGSTTPASGLSLTAARAEKLVAHVPDWIVDQARRTTALRNCADAACRVRARNEDRPLTAAEVDRARRLYRVIKANNPSLERRRLHSEVTTSPGSTGSSLTVSTSTKARDTTAPADAAPSTPTAPTEPPAPPTTDAPAPPAPPEPPVPSVPPAPPEPPVPPGPPPAPSEPPEPPVLPGPPPVPSEPPVSAAGV